MESNQANAAAVRAFRVLEVVAGRADGCTLADIVDAIALPKQTVHRLVGQLQRAGLLIREPAGRRLQLGQTGFHRRHVTLNFGFIALACQDIEAARTVGDGKFASALQRIRFELFE